MFSTRFTKINGKTEDFKYYTQKEAINLLLLYKKDVSGLYKSIAVLNDKNLVLHILPFENGVPSEVISIGSCVMLKEEYSSQEERARKDIYIVTNINEHTYRVNITCLTTDMLIKPSETVGIETVKAIKEINVSRQNLLSLMLLIDSHFSSIVNTYRKSWNNFLMYMHPDFSYSNHLDYLEQSMIDAWNHALAFFLEDKHRGFCNEFVSLAEETIAKKKKTLPFMKPVQAEERILQVLFALQE